MGRTHGGDWYGFLRETGREPLDFSASLSPLGMPPGAERAAAAALKYADRYPDPECRRLKERLGEHLGVPAEEILCGAGAAELIWHLALALGPGRAVIPQPTFSEYGLALRKCFWQVEDLPMENLELGRDLPGRLDGDLLVLCLPNNPTGLLPDRELLREVLGVCREKGILVAADQCFAEFCPEADLLPLTAEYENLLVFRAFTKFYGLAGLRLGYCVSSDRGLLRRMAESGPPWSVSVPAQEAGIAALEDRDYAARLLALMETERPRLQEALEDFGFRVLPGRANFLLFETGLPELGDRLRDRGILLRDCRDFPGLGPGWYRTAVRTRADNDRLLQAIREVLSWP